MPAPKTLARVGGPLYLLLIVAAAFALSVRSGIVEPGAAAATADNIRASATLFRFSDEYTRSFGRAGADALTLLSADTFSNGNTVNAIWYGPWLIPLGYLVVKSGYFPKVLGVLPIIGCFLYLGWLLTTFLAPDAPAVIGSALLAVAGIGEGAFVVWLAVRGIRLPAAARARTIPEHAPE